MNIGLDLDGVVATHPMKGIFFHVRKWKEWILQKSEKTNYFYPVNNLEELIWKLINNRRNPFIDKNEYLSKLKNDKSVHLFLVTSRFKFLKNSTQHWLKKHKLDRTFEKILHNETNLNPVAFKKNMVQKLKLDFLIEDDPAVVKELQQIKQVKVIWLNAYQSETKVESDVIRKKDLNDALRYLLKVRK